MRRTVEKLKNSKFITKKRFRYPNNSKESEFRGTYAMNCKKFDKNWSPNDRTLLKKTGHWWVNK